MIPDKAAWKGYEHDMDFKYFHDLAFGKSNDQMQVHFGEGRSIERAGELQFVSQPIFEYYVMGFCLFILSGNAENDPDTVSSFLGLLSAREKQHPGSVCSVFDNLKETLHFIETRQVYFGAAKDIYGDFKPRVASICKMCQREL